MPARSDFGPILHIKVYLHGYNVNAMCLMLIMPYVDNAVSWYAAYWKTLVKLVAKISGLPQSLFVNLSVCLIVNPFHTMFSFSATDKYFFGLFSIEHVT